MHAIPVEGVMGRVISGVLVAYLNIQGAWLVALVLGGVGIYFASDISFKTIKTQVEDRWLNLVAWHDRYRNWKEDRAERKRELEERCMETQPGPAQRLFSGAIGDAQGAMAEDTAPPQTLTSKLAALFLKKKQAAMEPDPVEEIPAFQRTGKTAEEPIAARRSSIWEPAGAAVGPKATAAEAGRSVIEMRPTAPVAQAPAAVPAPVAHVPVPAAAARAVGAGGPGSIAIHERADVDERQVTVAPKHVRGYKLPPSTLLYRGEEPAVVREDALRDEARVLVEKCAEFDVRGQVTQINPGPVVTTFEFKPDAGVKYSRVTGLADDLCLAMAAESILIERMAGKSTVGHPGAEPGAGDDLAARRGGVREICARPSAAGDCDGQGHQRADRDGGPGDDAACADRGIDGLGQVGGDQRDDHERAVQDDAGAGEDDPGGSEAGGAGDVRGNPAPVYADHHGGEAGGECAAECGAGDGAAAEAAGEAQRAEHRPVQQAVRRREPYLFEDARTRSRCRTSSSSSTSWRT